jgi:hypothetical protein
MKAAATEAALRCATDGSGRLRRNPAMTFRRHVVSVRPPQPAPKGRPSASMVRMPRACRRISTLSACALPRLIPFMASLPAIWSRHCEPTGRANARPMTDSAKQSIPPRKERKSGLLRGASSGARRTDTKGLRPDQNQTRSISELVNMHSNDV